MISSIARREAFSGFLTPVPWVLLGFAQIALGWLTLRVIENHSGLSATGRVAGLTQALTLNGFGFAAVLLMLAAPLLAMRTFSGEFRDGSHELLATAPVRPLEIILGKYLGLTLLMTPLCLLPALNLLWLAGTAELDPGMVAAATLGLWLAALMFLAVGLYAATLTAQPGGAVMIAFALLVLFSVLGYAERLVGDGLSLFAWLTWNQHLFWFLVGAVRLSDLAYFLLFTLFFLALAHRALVNRRLP